MSIFEYPCRRCHRRFEQFVFERFVQGRHRPERPERPECAGGRLERREATFIQGRPGKKARGANMANGIAHLRSLAGNISAMPGPYTKNMNPPRTARAR